MLWYEMSAAKGLLFDMPVKYFLSVSLKYQSDLRYNYSGGVSCAEN